jgi:hypothetical protein
MHIFKENKVLSEKNSNILIDLPEDKIVNYIEATQRKGWFRVISCEDIKEKDAKKLRENILELSKCDVILFVALSKNDNPEEAFIIRKYQIT